MTLEVLLERANIDEDERKLLFSLIVIRHLPMFKNRRAMIQFDPGH